MLDTNDYKKYITQLEKIESSMAELYGYCVKNIEHKNIRDILKQLLNDEINHQNICKELYALLPASS